MWDRRQNQRIRTRGLSTPFGEVIDISPAGLAVFRKGRMDLELEKRVTLHLSYEGHDTELTARVVRIDPVGLFRHEIGFAFVDADEQTIQKVMAIAQYACSEFAGPQCWVAA